MNKYLLPIALVSMAASAMAGAQTPPTSSPPTDSTTAPSSSMQTPSSTGASRYNSGSDTTKSQVKDCIAKQKATNSQLTDTEAKAACDTKANTGG
jgi:hypothetical protein